MTAPSPLPPSVHAAGVSRRGQPVLPSVSAHTTLRPLESGAAEITGGFWRVRQERNGADAIRQAYDLLEAAGNFSNLRIAAGREEGPARGPIFMDSDVYKWLEAVAFEYGRRPSPDLLALQRDVTELVAAAQADDGYLDSVQQIQGGLDGRYSDLPWSHEHYCAGHLFQAAVAQVRCTGDTGLLEVAVRLADHLDATFGPGKRSDVDGHPVVEMGLVELFRVTSERRYLDLAAHFVEARGRGFTQSRGKEPSYFSDRLPVREAVSVEGHAVRAVYLGGGAADVALESGDGALLAALEIQFASMMSSKTFITGGLGARWEWESFGDPYELPADRGYAESCAAIGGIHWAWRLLLATGKAEYADAIERFLFNAFLPGVSLAGTEYFYVNPLQLRGGALADENRSPAHGRRGWFDCACCPPNIMRTFASLDGYLATTNERGIQIHQFASGEFAFEAGAVRVTTDYPWSGSVALEVTRSKGTWSLDVRIPSWSDRATLSVNGEPVSTSPGSYATVTRAFDVGDVIRLDLDMNPHLYAADARIDSVRGSVALERGPLVYALEHIDVAGVQVDDVVLDRTAPIVSCERPDLLDGIVTLELQASLSSGLTVHTASSWPYRRVEAAAPADEAVALPAAAASAAFAVAPAAAAGLAAVPATAAAGLAADFGRFSAAPAADIQLTAIPYFAWANREIGAMRVWIPAL